MGINNESENNYINMVKENYELLIQLVIDKEVLDKILSGDKKDYLNMDSKIVEMLFFIETLKTFGLFSDEKRLQRDARLGGGFYTDGYIYGYDLTYDDEKYRIVLDNKYITDERKCLEFGKTDDIEILKKQKEMLEKFKGFSNSQTIIYKLNFVEQNIKLLQARDYIYQSEGEMDSKNEKIELLELLYEKDEKQRYDIVINLESDDKKVELMELLYEEDEQKRAQIIISLESDDKKIELLDTIQDEWKRAQIIISLKSDDKKIESMDRIKDAYRRCLIIENLESDDKKIELLETIEKVSHKAEIISGLESDDKKIELLDTIEDDRYRAGIISGLKNDDKKIELLDTIDEDYHRIIIESLSKERLEAEFEYCFPKGWRRKGKTIETKESLAETPVEEEERAIEVGEQEEIPEAPTVVDANDIASLDVQSGIQETELVPIQEKGIKAFIKKMISRIRGK